MTKHESQTAPIGSSKEILITHGKQANAVAQWVLGEFQNSGEVWMSNQGKSEIVGQHLGGESLQSWKLWQGHLGGDPWGCWLYRSHQLSGITEMPPLFLSKNTEDPKSHTQGNKHSLSSSFQDNN